MILEFLKKAEILTERDLAGALSRTTTWPATTGVRQAAQCAELHAKGAAH